MDGESSGLAAGPAGKISAVSNDHATRAIPDATSLHRKGDWPMPMALPDGLPPVAPFEYELLPSVLHHRVQDVADRMQCPPDYPAVALLVAMSSLVGRRCGIAPKRSDDWLVVPNLWGMVIGRPGIMKSPPLAEVMRHVNVLEAAARKKFEFAQGEYKAEKMVLEASVAVTKDALRKLLKKGESSAAAVRAQESVDRGDAAPICGRYIVNDTTVEKLGELLTENPLGLMLFRDELNGFFRTLDRQGHEADRAFYLEAWNGNSGFTYDRIGRGTLHIPGACISVLGGIQPGPLSELVRRLNGGGDDGLLQRFQLAVWPDVGLDWRNIDRAPDLDATRAVQDVFDRLDHLTAERLGADPGDIPILRFSPDAQDLFDTWRSHLELKLRGGLEHPLFEGHFAKYRSLVPSLALLLHLAASPEGPVQKLPLEQAIGWADYLESHARRIYAPAVRPDIDAARLLAKRIQEGSLGSLFALRDIYNNGWTGLSTRDEVAAAVNVLIDYDWLREFSEPTSGRTRTIFVVNPGVAMQ